MMKRTRTSAYAPRAVLAAAFLAAAAGSARAAFDFAPAGANSAAMGGSILAARGDSAAMFLNPAGLSGLGSSEAYFMYDKFYAGLGGVDGIGQGLATVAVPTKAGTLGVGFTDLRASGLLEERVIGVSFARRWFDGFDAGVTGKYLHHRYLIGSDAAAAADPVFRDGASRGAISLDFGLAARVAGPLTAALAVRNVNRPDVGLATEDRIPREYQAGLSYDVEAWRLKLTADYLLREAGSGSLRERGVPSVGLEKTLEEGRVKLRLGATPDQFSAGGGLQLGRLGFDYAFVLSRNLMSDNAGTHMIGVRYRFGGGEPSSARDH
jgi:hypothetical protein